LSIFSCKCYPEMTLKEKYHGKYPRKTFMNKVLFTLRDLKIVNF